MADLSFAFVCDGPELKAVRELFQEYGESLDFDLCFQGFDDELASLPGRYAPPEGTLILAQSIDGKAVGCVGIRPLTKTGEAEMKRLFVREPWRGSGLGRQLAKMAISCAVSAGYTTLRLDTLPGQMAVADSMYRDMGFEPTPPYYENPVPGAVYYALALKG